METNLPMKHAMKIEREKLAQEVMDLFDTDDGKTFEEKLHRIDNDLKLLAEKFSVEPRKLLSHVLEYSLKWDKIADDDNS